MKTIEELKAEQAKALAKLETEHTIAQLCPVVPDRVQLTSGGLATWVMYQADSIVDAIALFDRFEAIPFFHYRGTFTRVQPEALATDKSGEITSGPFAASLKIDQGAGYGPSAELLFFFKAGDSLCQAHVRLGRKFGPDKCHEWAANLLREKDQRARTVIVGWRANVSLSAVADHTTRWGKGADDSACYEYSFAADYVDGGQDHARGQMAVLAEEQRRATFRSQPFTESFLSVMLEDLQMSEDEEACGDQREARDCGTIWTAPESTVRRAVEICRAFDTATQKLGDIGDAAHANENQAGSDLYMEMVGHGVGFSDRDCWHEEREENRRIAEALSAAVDGRLECYIGDDCRPYIVGSER